MNRTTMFHYELIVLEPFNRTITKIMTCSHRYRLFTILRYVQVKCFKAAPYKIQNILYYQYFERRFYDEIAKEMNYDRTTIQKKIDKFLNMDKEV